MTTDNAHPLSKSDDFEQFVEALNESLIDRFRLAEPTPSSWLSAQIVGLPRSGTTVLYQLLAQTRCVGYPSNLMALFWRTPTVGARIQKHFAANEPTLSLHSFAGRTSEPLDPHEFGYFWRSMLGHSENSLLPDIDDEELHTLRLLRESLNAIAETFKGPVVYKNFLALAHAQRMRQLLPNARFIVTERPLEDIAASLLTLRRKVGAGMDQWIGLKPPHSESFSFGSEIDMVAFQVAELEKRKQECGFDQANDSVVVPYRLLCADPQGVVEDLLDFLQADRSSFRPDHLPRTIESGAGAAHLNHEEQSLLKDAIDSALA